MRRFAPTAVAVAATLAVAACGGSGHGTSGRTASGPPARLRHPGKLTATAPRLFALRVRTTKGTFVVTVHRAWAPRGADRLYELAAAHFFDGVAFFRVVPGFVVQFGISPYPQVSQAWRTATIPDDPVTHPNTRGTVTFATAGPDTRTTQLFVNLGDNSGLDSQGFAPVGAVTSGMDVVARLYSGYGDAPTAHQDAIEAQGEAWLRKHYPKLDSITATAVASVSG